LKGEDQKLCQSAKTNETVKRRGEGKKEWRIDRAKQKNGGGVIRDKREKERLKNSAEKSKEDTLSWHRNEEM